MISALKKLLGSGNNQDWPFDQEKSAAAITTKQVIHNGFPILQVSHYSDDHSWAFTCGTTDDSDDALVVSMEEVVSIDSSLFKIADLPAGWSAWRKSQNSPWQRQKESES